MATILQTAFSTAFPLMKAFEFQIKFHGDMFIGVYLTIGQQWFG